MQCPFLLFPDLPVVYIKKVYPPSVPEIQATCALCEPELNILVINAENPNPATYLYLEFEGGEHTCFTKQAWVADNCFQLFTDKII